MFFLSAKTLGRQEAVLKLFRVIWASLGPDCRLQGLGDLGNSYEVNLEDHETFNGRVGIVQTFSFTTSATKGVGAQLRRTRALSHNHPPQRHRDGVR
jgi:hypothetical protein